MKLDLTREQREQLGVTIDVIQEQIDSLRDRKEELLERLLGTTGALRVYISEREYEVHQDIMGLVYLKEKLECLTS